MKTIFFSIVIAALFAGLVGCGKSEAEKERDAARQKFTEAVAAMKVRAQSSTYSEFRQAELDLKTSYEVNKANLDDVSDQFANLDALMAATDDCWSYSINRSGQPVHPKFAIEAKEWQSMQLLNPDVANKSDYTDSQIEGTSYQVGDPDFYPAYYVKKGLTKIGDQANVLLNSLKIK